jgi:hypothetical protein
MSARSIARLAEAHDQLIVIHLDRRLEIARRVHVPTYPAVLFRSNHPFASLSKSLISKTFELLLKRNGPRANLISGCIGN